MACNPFTATVGMGELAVQNYQLQQSSLSSESVAIAFDYSNASKNALTVEIKRVCAEMLKKVASEVVGTRRAPETEVKDLDMIYEMVSSRARKKAKVDSINPVEDEVNHFFHNEINWNGVLKHSKVAPCPAALLKQIGNKQLDYLKHWEMIANHFEIMEWWESTGKVQYPNIYIIACIILPLPDSNGSQERTFSSATWMDGKLNKRQSDATFQMKVILQQNTKFLDKARIEIMEEHLKAAAESTKKLVLEAMERRRKEIDGEESEDDSPSSGTLPEDDDNNNDDSVLVVRHSESNLKVDEVDEEEEAVEALYD